jgi:hypothetical protein
VVIVIRDELDLIYDDVHYFDFDFDDHLSVMRMTCLQVNDFDFFDVRNDHHRYDDYYHYYHY